MRDLVIRHSEPEDYRAVHLVWSPPLAMSETLGVPFSSEQAWREEFARERDDNISTHEALLEVAKDRDAEARIFEATVVWKAERKHLYVVP